MGHALLLSPLLVSFYFLFLPLSLLSSPSSSPLFSPMKIETLARELKKEGRAGRNLREETKTFMGRLGGAAALLKK